MTNGALIYDVVFSGLDALKNLKLPDFKFNAPDFSSLLGGLKLPSFGLPPIPPGFGVGIAAVFTAAAAAGLAAFSVGMQSLLSELQAGVKLQVDLSKSLGSAAIKAGESQTVFKKNVNPTIIKLLGNESIATPLNDITDTVKSLAGQGLDSTGIATILPTVQQFSGSTGGEVNLNQAADLLFGQLQKLNLKATVENVSDIAAINSAAANTGKLTPEDTKTFLKYALSSGDGSREGNLKAQADLLKTANLLTNAGLDASSAGTGLRAFQTSLLDTKKIAKSGFDIKMKGEDGGATGVTDRLEQVLKQFIATREGKGLDAANKQAVALVGDSGLPIIQALASVKNTAELEAKFSEMNKTFDGKVSGAAANMARVAVESAQSLAGSISAYENAREGLQLKLGAGAENLVAVLAKGGAAIVNSITQTDGLFNGMQTQFDNLAKAFSGLKMPAFIGTMATILAQAITYAAEFVATLLGTPLWQQLMEITNSIVVLFQSLGTVIVGVVESVKAIANGLAALGLGTILAIVVQIVAAVINVIGIIAQIGAALMGSRSSSQVLVGDFSSIVVALEQFNAWLITATPKLVEMATSAREVLLPTIQAIASVFSSISRTVSELVVGVAKIVGVVAIGLTQITQIWNGLSVLISASITTITAVVQSVFKLMGGMLQSIGGAVLALIETIKSSLTGLVAIVQSVVNTVVSSTTAAVTQIRELIISIISVIQSIGSAVAGVAAIVQSTLVSAFAAVSNTVIGIVNLVTGLIAKIASVTTAFNSFKVNVSSFRIPDFKPNLNGRSANQPGNINVNVQSTAPEIAAVAKWSA
jgi:phage-related protein